MNEKVRDVFDILGVEPNEEFKIIHKTEGDIYPEDKYFLTEDLVLISTKTGTWTNGLRFLLCYYDIVKIPRRLGDLRCSQDYCIKCPLKSICGIVMRSWDTTGETLYTILDKWSEDFVTLPGDVCDVIKSILDKEIQI